MVLVSVRGFLSPTAAKPRRPSGFFAIVARLTGVNVVLLLVAFVTSPILARALGPAGRGELAAIFAVLTLAPWISDLGMASYLSVAHARRDHPVGVLLGSTVPTTLAASFLGVVLAFPVAHLLGRGRPEVIFFIEIGLVLLPVSVFLQTLYGIVLGAQRWRTVMCARLASTGLAAVGIVGLSVTRELTVATAAVTYIVSGLAANGLYLIGLKGSRPWSFDKHVARTGASFGTKTWISTLASTGTGMLDQLLMAGLVSSRQLGWYALAVTLATAPSALASSTATALVPRVAAGEPMLAARACRVALLMTAIISILLAAVSPIAIPLVFGPAFRPVVPMLWVLLGGGLFFVPGQVLSAAVIAANDPGGVVRAQLAGLLTTVGGLLVFLPIAGAMGAAWVTLASYAVLFLLVLVGATRRFDLPCRAFLLPHPGDVRWIATRVLGAVRLSSGDMRH
jgi:O-antigen/teichoic acid export membrane protein